jgi:hypothetical protein
MIDKFYRFIESADSRRYYMKRLIARLIEPLVGMTDLQYMVEVKMQRQLQFVFNSNLLTYFNHSYNCSGLTERIIEIPITKFYLEQKVYQNVLEIGNVTNHYYDYFRNIFRYTKKTVIDKYEVGNDVTNQDIGTYLADDRYDFIFSISTFEHMDSDLGRNADYLPGKSKLITEAADNMRHVTDFLLEKGGKFLITAPLGYTPEWDLTFYSDAFDHCEVSGYRRYLFSRRKELFWEQVDIDEGRSAKVTSHLMPYREFLSIVELEK